MEKVVAAALVALYTGGATPEIQMKFADPAKCAIAAATFNEVLPKFVSIAKDTTVPKRALGKLDTIIRYVCLDGVTD